MRKTASFVTLRKAITYLFFFSFFVAYTADMDTFIIAVPVRSLILRLTNPSVCVLDIIYVYIYPFVTSDITTNATANGT